MQFFQGVLLGSNGDIWSRGWKSHEAKEELSLVTTQQLHPPNTCGQDGDKGQRKESSSAMKTE